MPTAAKGLAVLGGALAVGVAADFLLHGRPLGVNVFVLAVVFVAALALSLRAAQAPPHQGRRFMALPLLLFAGLFALHDSRLLVAANLLALAGAVSLGALRRAQPRPHEATLAEYAAGLAAAGAGTLAGSVELLERDVPWGTVTRGARGERAVALARGAAISVPFLAVFGALFVAADGVFGDLLRAALPARLSSLWPHALVALAVAWLAGGLLRDLVADRDDSRLVSTTALLRRRPALRMGGLEVAVALGALDALFAAFVLVQARYLFGGSDVVLARQGLTYAQYARHGFFELVAVSLLVVPVVLVANGVARDRRNLVRGLCALLVGLELAVAASALQRMHVYVQQYGLTELRIYATGVMLWIAAVLVWAVATVLYGRGRRFAVGAIAAGFAATLALNVISPDAMIARTNLDRPRIDPSYLAHLSDDAVPTLVDRLPGVTNPGARRLIARELLARRFDADVVGWNLARERARDALARHRAELELLAH